MSDQKLNLSTIPGIQEMDDCAAEVFSGGSFQVTTGSGNRQTVNVSGNAYTASLRGADRLDIVNTNRGANNNPGDVGHDFIVTYLREGEEGVLGVEQLRYGQGVRNRPENATDARITQTPPRAGVPIPGFGLGALLSL